jgi:hypothetical protein
LVRDGLAPKVAELLPHARYQVEVLRQELRALSLVQEPRARLRQRR